MREKVGIKMCNQCRNNLLMETVETNLAAEALESFKQRNQIYLLPADTVVIDDGELIGFSTLSQHIEGIEEQFVREVRHREKPLDKIYIHTSELLKLHEKIVVLCIANKKGYACDNLNYIPGRRF